MTLYLTPITAPDAYRKIVSMQNDEVYVPSGKNNDDTLKNVVKYAAASWADIILIGLNDGKKPEILVDRSGSMETDFISNNGQPLTRMDISCALISMVADILRKRNHDFDLSQIPVKSWGSAVYDKHPVVKSVSGKKEWVEKVTTLADFSQNAFGSTRLPMIPCSDGTDHGFWFNESSYPLVITDDFGYRLNDIFVENYQNFSWCDGDNIIAIDNAGSESRMRKMHQKISE